MDSDTQEKMIMRKIEYYILPIICIVVIISSCEKRITPSLTGKIKE